CDVVGMAVAAVGAPAHDRARPHSRDVLPDPFRDLLAVRLRDATVGVVPQLDAAERERGGRLLELLRADLAQVLLLRAGRLARPPCLAVRGADQVRRYAGARMAEDKAAGAERLVVGMRHDREQASL